MRRILHEILQTSSMSPFNFVASFPTRSIQFRKMRLATKELESFLILSLFSFLLSPFSFLNSWYQCGVTLTQRFSKLVFTYFLREGRQMSSNSTSQQGNSSLRALALGPSLFLEHIECSECFFPELHIEVDLLSFRQAA